MISLANKHPRVNILNPGTGVGGHCIAVDPWFIVSEFPNESPLIKKSRERNTYKTEWVLEKIKNAALEFKVEKNKDPIIACMGLAFKPDIDDLRESPAQYVNEKLKNEKFTILSVEPNLELSTQGGLTSTNEAIEKADIIVFLVAHSDFKGLDINSSKRIIDFVGLI